MFKIIDSDEKMSFDEAREKYRGFYILMKENDSESGTVCAISDWDDIVKISDLQIKMLKENIRTYQIDGLSDDMDNSTLYVRKCELL